MQPTVQYYLASFPNPVEIRVPGTGTNADAPDIVITVSNRVLCL